MASEKNIQRWLESLARHGLILWYEVDKQPYLEILRFGQPVRIKQSEFPSPPESQGYIDRYIDPDVRREILSAGICEDCGGTEDLSVDHCVPVTKGGKGNRENLRCVCRRCNSKKGTRLLHEML